MAGGSNVCIICTSTLELGIDVGELDYIFQHECPAQVSSFMQRMGRTGRRPGTVANTTFFVTANESLQQAVAMIELARRHWVESIHCNRRSWHLLVHQLFAMCLQHGAISRYDAWGKIDSAYCFSGIKADEYKRLVNHLVAEEFLAEESGLLSMGLAGESKFGKFNFMELYCVFSGALSFDVKTIGGQFIGTVDGEFAESLSDNDCFLLAGRPWQIDRIEYEGQIFWVKPSMAGKSPKWGGFNNIFLSYELCRKVNGVLSSEDTYPYCDKAARLQLESIRQDFFFLQPDKAPLHLEGDHLFWWTFAGGKVNNTIKELFKYLLGAEVVSSNYYVKLKQEEVDAPLIQSLIEKMKSEEFWQEPGLQKDLISQLPVHRLSKFQDCLPLWAQFELVGHELLDIEGVQSFLNNVGVK